MAAGAPERPQAAEEGGRALEISARRFANLETLTAIRFGTGKMGCSHPHRRCLNEYDTFRKYLCENCGGVFMCECEHELATIFLPHQTRSGQEYGTRRRYPVAGVAKNICRACRGEPEPPAPRAAIYDQKGKIQRYYWREITKTYYQSVLEWIRGRSITIEDIIKLEAEYPEETKKLKKAARKHWQQRHKEDPKYDTSEQTHAQFLAKVRVPEIEVEAEYVQEQRGEAVVGKWKLRSGELRDAEDVAVDHYESSGYRVYRCERKLISTLVAVFCWPVIQDPSDPRGQRVMRGSTVGWKPGKQTPLVHFLLSEDFGSAAFYERRRQELAALFDDLRQAGDLSDAFESRLPGAQTLRDYLWVAEDDAAELARAALAVIPRDVILAMAKWVIRDFWQRQPGWPDLFLIESTNYRFSEVKSPNDKLSLKQMRWFEWALVESDVVVPCEICRVVKSTNGS